MEKERENTNMNNTYNHEEENTMVKSIININRPHNFLSLLHKEEVQDIHGMLLYKPKSSMVYLPLYIREDDEMIHLIPQDNLPPSSISTVFGDDCINPNSEYSFDKKLMLKVFEEEPEYIPDFIAILEMYNDIAGTEVLKLLKTLKQEGFELVNILRVLAGLTPDGLERLMEVAEFMQVPLRQYFIELDGQISKEDEEN